MTVAEHAALDGALEVIRARARWTNFDDAVLALFYFSVVLLVVKDQAGIAVFAGAFRVKIQGQSVGSGLSVRSLI